MYLFWVCSNPKSFFNMAIVLKVLLDATLMTALLLVSWCREQALPPYLARASTMSPMQAQVPALSSPRYNMPTQGCVHGGFACAQFDASSFGNGMMHPSVFGARTQYTDQLAPHVIPDSLDCVANILREPYCSFSDVGG